MITLKSAREIEAMDRAGDFLASIHIGLRDVIKPGVDMWEVEEYVRRRCKEENVLPLQIGVDGSIMDYPYATCCGLNDEVAHAFPRHYILKEGDLLKVDMVMSEPLDKSVVDVSKLNFDNVEQVKKYTQSYSVVWLSNAGHMQLVRFQKKLKTLWTSQKNAFILVLKKLLLVTVSVISVQRFKNMLKAAATVSFVIW